MRCVETGMGGHWADGAGVRSMQRCNLLSGVVKGGIFTNEATG
jgi:hypothetical protein